MQAFNRTFEGLKQVNGKWVDYGSQMTLADMNKAAKAGVGQILHSANGDVSYNLNENGSHLTAVLSPNGEMRMYLRDDKTEEAQPTDRLFQKPPRTSKPGGFGYNNGRENGKQREALQTSDRENANVRHTHSRSTDAGAHEEAQRAQEGKRPTADDGRTVYGNVISELRNHSHCVGSGIEAEKHIRTHPSLSYHGVASIFIDREGKVYVLDPHTHEDTSQAILQELGISDADLPDHILTNIQALTHVTKGPLHSQVYLDGVGAFVRIEHAPF